MIYFVQKEDKTIKIGFTQDIHKRLQALRYGNGPLKLLGVLKVQANYQSQHVDRAFERAIHGKFQHLSQGHEWFSPGKDLLAYIRKNAELPKPEDPYNLPANLTTRISLSADYEGKAKKLDLPLQWFDFS